MTTVCVIIIMKKLHRGVAQMVARMVRDHEAASSSLATPTMQSVLIGSEYPVMDTLLFYFSQNLYCNLFRGVAECYAFSRFHDNVGLRDLPAIRHIKGTDAVIVNNDALIGNAVLLFGVVHLNMVDQLCNHPFVMVVASVYRRTVSRKSSMSMRLLSSFFSSSRSALIFLAFSPCSCS